MILPHDTTMWVPVAQVQRADGVRVGLFRSAVGGYRDVVVGTSTTSYGYTRRAEAEAHFARESRETGTPPAAPAHPSPARGDLR